LSGVKNRFDLFDKTADVVAFLKPVVSKKW
jgi:hypothetical protein